MQWGASKHFLTSTKSKSDVRAWNYGIYIDMQICILAGCSVKKKGNRAGFQDFSFGSMIQRDKGDRWLAKGCHFQVEKLKNKATQNSKFLIEIERECHN